MNYISLVANVNLWGLIKPPLCRIWCTTRFHSGSPTIQSIYKWFFWLDDDSQFFAYADDMFLLYNWYRNGIHTFEADMNESLALFNFLVLKNVLCINTPKSIATLFNFLRAGFFNLSINLYENPFDFVVSMSCLGLLLDNEHNLGLRFDSTYFSRSENYTI